MDESIILSEENYNFWKTGAIISAVLSIITFTVFWNLADPFWISIARLGAFIFFAITIISYLQIMNGPIEIELHQTGDNILISYLKNGKTIQEEQFDKGTIKDVFTTTSGVNFLLHKLKPNLKTFKISFTDTENQLFMFEYGGRPLLFSKNSQEKILKYLQNLS